MTSRPVTTLLVTHDLDEAIGLADRLFLLSPSPARVVAELPIARPRGPFAAERAAIRAEIVAPVGQGGGVATGLRFPRSLPRIARLDRAIQ